MRGDLERIFAALAEARVRYLVVGGVAVVLHGFVRLTRDLDLVVQLQEDNVHRALEALEGLGFHPRVPVPMEMFADADNRRQWQDEKNMVVFSAWHEESLFTVDLFLEEPFDFDAVYERAAVFEIAGQPVTVLPRPELLDMKRQAGRAQDLADIEELTRLDGDNP